LLSVKIDISRREGGTRKMNKLKPNLKNNEGTPVSE